MREYVEFVSANRVENVCRDVGWIEPRLPVFDKLGEQPAAVGTDMRQEGSDTVQNAHQVDVEHPPPGVECDRVDAAATADTSIVADDMDCPECKAIG